MAISQEALDDLARRGAARGVDPAPGLALVEERLRTSVATQLPFLEQASRYLIDAGGKRFRPLLVLLAGMLGGRRPTDDDLVDAGVIVELVHLSTLYHDDVIDAAEVRRGTPAAHVKWSNSVAILTGDFLLARASEPSASLGVEVSRLMARTIAELCQGEIRELQGAGPARRGARPARRPRALPARDRGEDRLADQRVDAPGRAARGTAGRPGRGADRLRLLLGMAFQLSDDILDVAGDRGSPARSRARTCARGCGPCRCCSPWSTTGRTPSSPACWTRPPPRPPPVRRRRGRPRTRAAPDPPGARACPRHRAHGGWARATHALAPIARTPDTAVLLDGLAELADYAVDRVR